MLQAWQKVYPSTLKPISEMSGELMSHVRYPTDLFKVQRALLGVYHVDTAQSFYQRDNAWATPNDPQTDARLQPPYYLTMQMPGQEAPGVLDVHDVHPVVRGRQQPQRADGLPRGRLERREARRASRARSTASSECSRSPPRRRFPGPVRCRTPSTPIR